MRAPLFSLLAVLTGLTASACGRHTPALETRTLTHQDRARTYHVFRPPGHAATAPAPLVVALHGGGGAGAGFDRTTNGQFTAAASKRGMVVVFPEGVAKGWNDGRAPVSARDEERAGVDDVGFLTRLVDTLHAEMGIDRGRVYFTGISNGGFMTQRYAIEHPERVAAAAAVTAQVAEAWADRSPARPVSMMLVNGTADPLVPYAGGQVTVFGTARGAIRSTADSVEWWRRHAGCAEPPAVSPLPDADPDDGTRAIMERSGPCEGGSEVVLVRVEGGGHTWPGGRQYLPRGMVGPVSNDFRAVDVIFDFFERHRR